MNNNIKLAISGTYSTGKSLTTEALSLLTGIPRTHALTSREILAAEMPGKEVQELSASELLQLGLRRLEERIHNEGEGIPSFISDGSVIHEWVYGVARLKVGVNPNASFLLKLISEIIGLPSKPFYKTYMKAYGNLVKSRAKRIYDAYVHLPVEFDMVADNHRPVSENFRNMSDRILINTLNELKIPYYIVGGTVDERLEKICQTFKFNTLMPINEAIQLAKEKVDRERKILEEHSIEMKKNRNSSTIKKLKYIFRY